jgi:adenosylhomocysteine nucleosidase
MPHVAEKIGILAPMPLELKPLLAQTCVVETETRAGLKMLSGTMRGRQVALAVCGIGKVNAAMAAQAMIDFCDPDALILTGVSGALRPDVAPGDVLVVERFHQYDIGALREGRYSPLPVTVRNPRGTESRSRFFSSNERLVELATECARSLELPYRVNGSPRVVKGAIITGDVLMLWPQGLEWLSRAFDAVAIDMEGAAVAQVARANGVELLAIRGISDVAADLADLEMEKLLSFGESARLGERVGQLGDVARFVLGRPRAAGGALRLIRAMNGAARNAAALVAATVATIDEGSGVGH